MHRQRMTIRKVSIYTFQEISATYAIEKWHSSYRKVALISKHGFVSKGEVP